jgi:hypothetical protein
METSLQGVRHFIGLHSPERLAAFDAAYEKARDVVIIGSAAVGRLGPTSDLDLLFVGQGERVKTQWLDLLWVPQKKIESKSWLGSELATHAARYGVWLKGAGEWRPQVFFSRLTVTHKCERILVRLAKIYAKRHSLSQSQLEGLAARCVLDMQRVVLLASKCAVPPTDEVVGMLVRDPEKMFSEVCSEHLLGDLGRFFVERFVQRNNVIEIILQDQRGRIWPAR